MKNNLFLKKIINIFKQEYFLLLLIILLGLVLRLINLGTEPYWGDEAFGLGVVKHYYHNFSGMMNYLQEATIYPPLYYIFLKFWTVWFGFSELATRSLSLLFGLGVIWLAYWAGKIFFPKTKFGLWAAFLVAILPIQIEYSQEARPYIQYCFFGLLNIIALWQFREKKHTWSLLLFIASAIIGLYLHYSFVFVLGATFSWWLLDIFIRKQKTGKEIIYWLSSCLIILLSFYVWFENLLYKSFLLQQDFFNVAAQTKSTRPFYFLESTINNLIWLTKEQSISYFEILAVSIFKLAFMAFLFLIIYQQRDRLTHLLKQSGKQMLYFLWLLVVPLLLFMFSPYSVSYIQLFEKHLIVSSIAIAFIVAMVLTQLKSKYKAFLIILFMVSVFNFNIRVMADDSTWDSYHRVEFVADHINENYKKGDVVLVYMSFSRSDLNYFLRPDISAVGFYPTIPLENDYLASRDTLGFLENESHFRIVKPAHGQEEQKIKYIINSYQPERLWLIYFPDDSFVFPWLGKNNWRHATHAVGGDLFPVNLFVKR